MVTRPAAGAEPLPAGRPACLPTMIAKTTWCGAAGDVVPAWRNRFHRIGPGGGQLAVLPGHGHLAANGPAGEKADFIWYGKNGKPRRMAATAALAKG